MIWRAGILVALIAGSAQAQVFGPSGAVLRVNTYTTGQQAGGSVAMDDAGNFEVVWSGAGPDGGDEVYAQRFTFAAPTGSQFRVNTYTTGSQHGGRIAFNPLGTGAVVWVSPQVDGLADVIGQRVAGAGAAGTEFRVNTYTTGYQSYVDVSADGAGGFVVVWASANGGIGSEVWGQRYASNGVAQGGAFHVNTYTTGEQGRPAVARAPGGQFVIVWQSSGQLPSGGVGIYGQRYGDTGTPLGGEFQISSTYTTGASNPSVAVDAGGKFVVAWMADGGAGSYSDVYARRYLATGAPAAAEFRVNTATADGQSYPLVTAMSNNADPTGTFVVAWNSGSLYGGVPGVFAQRYVGSGAPIGGAFRVTNSTTAFVSGIAHDLNEDFVVTWTEVGAGADVYLRRYCHALAGDANADGTIDVSDVFYLINFLFANGAAPLRNVDANGDNQVDVADVFYLINFLFAGGAGPSCPIVLA
jgi:hypothetical protein